MQKLLKEKGLDGALFIFPIDVYYYAGTRQNSTLWMPAEGEPMLLVRKSYARAKEESPLADVRPFPSSKDFPALFGDHLEKDRFYLRRGAGAAVEFLQQAPSRAGIYRHLGPPPRTALRQVRF